MTVINVRYRWPQAPGKMVRPDGAEEYVLLHLYQPVVFKIREECNRTRHGAFVVLSPGVPYQFHNDEDLWYDWMHITGEVIAALRVYGLFTETFYQPSNNNKITSLIEEIEFAFYEKPYYWWRFAEIKLEELFMLISQNLGQRKYPNENDETTSRLKAIRSEMMTYPERDWSVKVLAFLLHISQSRVYPLYRNLCGISPNQDLIQMRVNKAKRLLLEGHTVTETAECVGYNSLNHFSRQFLRVTGFSPTNFQRQAVRATLQ